MKAIEDFSKHEMYEKALAIFADYEKSEYQTFDEYLNATKVAQDMSYEDAFSIYILCQKMMWGDEYILRINGSGEMIYL